MGASAITFIILLAIVPPVSLVLIIIDFAWTDRLGFDGRGIIGMVALISALVSVGFGVESDDYDEAVGTKEYFPTDVTKSENNVYVEFDNYSTITMDTYEDYTKISDSTKFYTTIYQNAWGSKAEGYIYWRHSE